MKIGVLRFFNYTGTLALIIISSLFFTKSKFGLSIIFFILAILLRLVLNKIIRKKLIQNDEQIRIAERNKFEKQKKSS